ncbi:DUF6545 domain-containing protein [Nocardia terpenica]|uniref:DUF6545 domain-containing protein n=1 Tax=Nocardia terpenica TaxID=455432 RepID=A0A6G9ZD96_9NOCA|nr:DUF6545 domain-containing protein [Nocardia terpenica]QIS23589.1 hypothetical protein F6W96_40320 [Nocardia terpenica]
MLRIAFVRARTDYDRLIHACAASAATMTALNPVVAECWPAALPGGMATTVDAWHWMSVLAGAFVLALIFRRACHDDRSRFVRRFRWLLLAAIACGPLFFILSSPARAAGGESTIVDVGGWRYDVYGTVYWLPPIIGSFFVLRDAAANWRAAPVALDRLVLCLWCIFQVGILIDATVWVVALASRRIGIQYAGLHRLQHFAAIELEWARVMSLLAVPWALMLAPSLIQVAARALRLDEESRAARQMFPVWQALTAAAPGSMLPQRRITRWFTNPSRRVHRMRVEISDAATFVAAQIHPLPPIADTMIDQFDEADRNAAWSIAEIIMAAERLAARSGKADDPTGEVYTTDVPDVATLVRLWKPVRAMVTDMTATASASSSLRPT